VILPSALSGGYLNERGTRRTPDSGAQEFFSGPTLRFASVRCCPNFSGEVVQQVRGWGRGASYANAINNSGQVTGQAGSKTGDHAFLYSNFSMTDLGSLGGPSTGNAINEAGQVAGFSYLPSGGDTHAVLFSKGTALDLGTLYGGSSTGQGISSSGQVTGVSGQRGFLYSNGKMTALYASVDGHLGICGTLKLVSWNGFTAQQGQRFDLLDWGSESGSFDNIDVTGLHLAPGMRSDASQLYIDGSISVQAVPEPETYPLLLSGLAVFGASLCRRGSGRSLRDRSKP